VRGSTGRRTWEGTRLWPPAPGKGRFLRQQIAGGSGERTSGDSLPYHKMDLVLFGLNSGKTEEEASRETEINAPPPLEGVVAGSGPRDYW